MTYTDKVCIMLKYLVVTPQNTDFLLKYPFRLDVLTCSLVCNVRTLTESLHLEWNK